MNLIAQAYIHRSYLNENRSVKESNERLEFLGDSVLQLLTSKFLYNKYPQMPEGKLTNLRSSLVRGKTLATIARKMDIGSKLLMSKGEMDGGGANNDAILADAVEALIGAMFLENGLESVDTFLQEHLFPHTDDFLTKLEAFDYKSKAQEVIQEKYKVSPKYVVVDATGPDHDKTFIVQLSYNDKVIGSGKGKSKQEAEELAAKDALENSPDLK